MEPLLRSQIYITTWTLLDKDKEITSWHYPRIIHIYVASQTGDIPHPEFGQT